MSTTLNLVDRLLAMGRNYQERHRHGEALKVLGRLAAFGELPAEVAEEAQCRLAEIHIKRKKHHKARRHLTAALLYRPDSARYHFLMATTLDTRTASDQERAADHYRKSLELDPKQPLCMCAYGLLSLRMGQVDIGLKMLRRAGELAPDDCVVIAKLVKGLRLAERGDEALSVLQAARFRNPRDGRFLKLYNDFMFRQLRRRQTTTRRNAAIAMNEDGPVLLPFIRLVSDVPPMLVDEKIIRLDDAQTLPAPHTLPRPVPRSDWKHG